VGNLQSRVVYNEGSEKEYVYVQGTCPPAAFPGSVPAETGFNGLDTRKEFPCGGYILRAGVKACYGGIYEPGLIRHVQGACFVERSRPGFCKKIRQGGYGAA